MRDINTKIIVIVLTLLALINVIFLVIARYSGPLFGFAFAIFATVHWLRTKSTGFIIVVAVIWLGIHIYELIVLGASSYPLLFYLNLLLPLPLLYCGVRLHLKTRKHSHP